MFPAGFAGSKHSASSKHSDGSGARSQYFAYHGGPSGLLKTVSPGTATISCSDLGSPNVPPSGRVDEAALLARVNDGDERAWNELVDHFAGLVWSVARSFRLSKASTDDVVQTVWLRLAEYSTRIREPNRLASWLATATRHEALRVIRGHQRLIPHSDFSESSEPTSRSIEDIIVDDVTLKAVLEAFDRLSPSDQQLLRLLCAVPPIDYQTIAETLGRSVGSIGPSRARCLEKLRRLLPAGIDPKAGAR